MRTEVQQAIAIGCFISCAFEAPRLPIKSDPWDIDMICDELTQKMRKGKLPGRTGKLDVASQQSEIRLPLQNRDALNIDTSLFSDDSRYSCYYLLTATMTCAHTFSLGRTLPGTKTRCLRKEQQQMLRHQHHRPSRLRYQHYLCRAGPESQVETQQDGEKKPAFCRRVAC